MSAGSGRATVDRLLLRWCQQSGPAEDAYCAAGPLEIDPSLFRRLSQVALDLDRLLRRFQRARLASASGVADLPFPEFPLAKEFFAGGGAPPPLFWGRFDVFERADGGVAVLEYNCDKPAGQREIWAGPDLLRGGANPNRQARAAFRRALGEAWRRHRPPGGLRPSRPRVAVLVAPSHREEFRLAYLFGREIAALGWEWEVVGGENLAMDGGRAVAYGRPVDIVLRQYPAEFLHELPAIADLWGASLDGRVLWLNDPRAVAIQAKSVFAHLWELVRDRRWLTPREARLVRQCVPLTGLAARPGWLARAAARPKDWVLKPVLGRYSDDVVLGAHVSPTSWTRALERAVAQPHDWVVQAYVPPRRRWLPAPAGERGRPGYVNWGVYLAAGRIAGLCPRLQPTPLTEEVTTWWAPLRLRRPSPELPVVLRPARSGPWARRGPGAVWQRIADRATLAGYTDVWTRGRGNFTLAVVRLSPGAWDEVVHATLTLGRAVGEALEHLGDERVLALLGLPEAVIPHVRASRPPGAWSFLSRFDWALTTEGRWRLLEINSDTPAGLWEAGLVAGEVARLAGRGRSVNEQFWPAVAASWRAAVERTLGAAAPDSPLEVGLAGALQAPEDADQLRAHARAAALALPRATIRLGHITDVAVRGGRAWLHGRPLDVLFRYYPLDWFADPVLTPLLDLAGSGRLALLPPAHCLLPQSKAFLVLLRELATRGFFPPAEAAAVSAYVPPTALEPRCLGRRPWVVKPYLEREGRGVGFSRDLDPRDRRRLAGADVVFQEELALATAAVPVLTARGWRAEPRRLVFGVFLAGDEVAGAYTRAGGRVTGREAVFVPLVV